ncbi:MAG: hypothetical protein HPY87_10180 [Fervidobacterium sp.]|uniref:hypothetical protein n=1 Tax=Fervidobacterium sp. TaxID=1871331 RepID=UPI0025BB17E1|nr:hypothetical protein [Fervidobacterium sp.]NPU90226.1 hypothetical protein [Fervidobacterium sp.]
MRRVKIIEDGRTGTVINKNTSQGLLVQLDKSEDGTPGGIFWYWDSEVTDIDNEVNENVSTRKTRIVTW